MLLKTISALTSIIVLATSAIAAPWGLSAIAPPWSLTSGLTNGPTSGQKLGVASPWNASKSGVAGATLACESPPNIGNISNNGGNILQGNVKIYYIFYGNWTQAEKDILTDFAKNIGGSNYSNIEISYGATGEMTYAGSIDDNYSLGPDLKEDGVASVVNNTLQKGLLPSDGNAVYFVLTSPDVQEGAFCAEYCGYHGNFTLSKTDIVYSFVGNAVSQCAEGCAPCNPEVSPNGDPGVDAMVSIVTHELMEAISDPRGNAWRDLSGYENGDKCNWNFGDVKKTKRNGFYNIVLGKRKYLVQQMWSAKTQQCEISA